ncbi:MAG: PAS domain S-box protein [Nitrospirae bacterium]|nr:PAS domain S-box protein [Nitrospirota bacterium]
MTEELKPDRMAGRGPASGEGMSEERFRSLADESPLAILTINADGTIEYINKKHIEIMGYSLEEIPNLGRWWALVYPDERQREGIVNAWKEIVRRVNGGEKIGSLERRVLCKDGTVKDVELRLTPSEGGMIVVFDDITEKRRMLDLLRQAKEDWEDSFNTIHDAITVHDREFNIVRANRAAEELLGLSFLTIKRQKCYESYHGSGRPPEGCPSCQTLKTGKTTVSEFFESHLGKYLEVKAFPRFDPAGEMVGLIHVIRDITEHKRIEDSLIASERKFRDLLETVQLAAIMLDLEGNVTFSNDYLLGLTGWKREEVLGSSWFERFPSAEVKDLAVSIFHSNIGMGTDLHHEYPILAKDGSERLIVWDFAPLRDAEGNITGTAGIGIDITDHRQVEDQLRQAQKMEAIGLLAGGVAHDFNNILTAIVGYSSLLLDRIGPGDSSHDYVSQILAASEKAASLTRSLLAFSRKQVINLKLVNINEILADMRKILGRIIGEDIELRVNPSADDLIVKADKSQIEQVLLNLATNARDAMPRGGVLTISTKNVHIDNALLQSQQEATGRYALITVSDTGSGMDEFVKEHIFEPFFTTKEVGKGTGLGMAMVFGTVKQHGGQVEVLSSPGNGAAIEIYLPLYMGIAETAQGEKMSLMKERGTETILLAEDDEMVRQLMSAVLTGSGYGVIEAVDGEDAVMKFLQRKDDIALAVLDVIMPKKNGNSVYREIRKIKPSLGVIFASGYADDILNSDGNLQSGMNFLSKPVKPAELLNMVRQVLDSPGRPDNH